MFGLTGRKDKKPQGISAKTPITDVRYVVVDTELTGLDEKKDCIVSIGAVRMIGGRIGLGDMFYRLVSPRTKLTADSVVIHEITPSEVAAQPAIETVLAEFLDYAAGDVLVGHFISIDLSFFNREMKRLYGHEISNAVIDTFTLDEWLRKRLKSHACFAKALSGIPVIRHRNKHRHPGEQLTQCNRGRFYDRAAPATIHPASYRGGGTRHRGTIEAWKTI